MSTVLKGKNKRSKMRKFDIWKLDNSDASNVHNITSNKDTKSLKATINFFILLLDFSN